MEIRFDFAGIASLTSACEDAIHQLERANKNTIGNAQTQAENLTGQVKQFLESGEAVSLRKNYSSSMTILAQRRDRLHRLLSESFKRLPRRNPFGKRKAANPRVWAS